ncbi:MAG: recombinase family protein [Oscillatoria sp. PMC 1068.18]|nr:recombinase family protein [Oscillatoria sp. PMC 1076.18]MEC4988422.1 recombinase family protein [Oscillatoria sp. PMC 1068.18]
MKIIAYLYSDPLLESASDPTVWGVDVDRVYQDLGKRISLQRLLADCQAEPPDYLLVRRLDELGDSTTQINETVAEVEALGINIIATEQPYISAQFSDSASVRANLRQLLVEIQDNQRSRHLRQGHARNRLAALPPPGKAPYGYRRGKERYIVDKSTAPVVKDFFDRFLLYGSLRGAVRYLEKKYAKKISVSTGRRWLSNPVYRGDLAYRNGEVISDTHAGIISREEAAQIDRLLRRNRSLPPKTASASRSLAGLVVCTECQSPMTVTKVTRRDKKQEYVYLRPIACPWQPKCKAIPYQQVLDTTIERICQDLPRAVSGRKMPDMEGIKRSLLDQIAEKQSILTQLPDLEKQGILDTETAQLRRYKLRTEIAERRSQIAQLPPVNLQAIAQTVSIPQFWLDLSETERRFYFREFIQQIQLTRPKNNTWQLQLKFIF